MEKVKEIIIHQSVEYDCNNLLELIANDCYNNMSSSLVSIGGSLMTVDSMKVNIDEIDINLVKKEDNSVIFNLSGPDYFNDTISTITNLSDSMSVPYSEGHKLRHELVCKIIDPCQTDADLSSIFKMQVNKTPDFVYYCPCSNPFYLIIEVSTTTNSNMAYKRVSNKIHNYYDTLMTIATHKNIKFFLAVIVVTPYEVISNVNIDSSTAKLMSLMWNIGENIYIRGVSEGLFSERILDEDETLDNVSATILRAIESAKYKVFNDKELTITQEYVNKVKNCEPDMNKCLNHFSTAFKTANKEYVRLSNNTNKLTNFDENVNSYFLNTDSRAHNKYKSIINMPFIKSSRSETLHITTDSNTPLQKMWIHCMDAYLSNETRILPEERARSHIMEAECRLEEEITIYEEERKKLRKSMEYPNIIRQEPGILSYLQSDGLWAKGSYDPLAHKAYQESKVPFSSTSPLEDVDNFIENQEIYQSHFSFDESLDNAVDLLGKASLLVGNNSDVPKDIIEKFSNTLIFEALMNISLIGTELSAELKHNVPRGNLIVKKVPNRQIYLAVFPTKCREHIFVSIFMPKADNNCGVIESFPFRECEETDSGYYFPFVSFKQHKLKNLIIAPYMFLNLISFWAHFYDIDLPTLINEDRYHQGFTEMINFCILVLLEDKSRTEEVITLSRYFYVDLMNSKGRINITNPAKLITKLPSIFRTRLELYVTKKLLSAVRLMIINPPKKIETEIDDTLTVDEMDDISKDSFVGLLNFVTLEELKKGSKAVQLMYMGYLVNKNKLTDKNTDFSMIKKLVSASLSVTKQDVSNLGDIEDNKTPKSQQFSLVCIKTGTVLLIEELKKKYGQKWQNILLSNICRNLSKHMTHEIATLKASCSAGLEDINSDESTGELYKAKKVLETINEHIDAFGLNPFVNIVKIIEILEDNKCGLIIKLFKKNQHGGLREISILEIHGRIVALFIETISRTICKEFDFEVLTHPENKLRLLESHKCDVYEKAKKSGSVLIESCNSSDKTKWNQNFTMHSLITPLLVFLPSSVHNILIRSFNIWVNKHILLPKSVIELLESKTILDDDTYKLVYKQYTGDFSDDCIPIFEESKQKFLNIQSCMMQGILHYTSSLLHCVFIALSKNVITHFLPKAYVTGVVTSDDSAIISSLIIPRNKTVKNTKLIKTLLDLLMMGIEEFSRWFSMTPSVKSVLACSNFVEFNSEFIIGNNLVVPTIKYVISSLNLSESESMIHRLDILYNQLSDVFSRGLPSQNTMVCQWSQGLLHYHSMGASDNFVFDYYCERISKYPDPALGFFPIDNEYLPGVLGLSYSVYQIKKTANIIKLPSKSLASADITTHKSGMISTNYILKMGDYARHTKLVESIAKMPKEEAEELIERNPSIIYLLPKNEEDIKIKLIMKSLAPGVANSLKHGDEFIKSFSASVYGLFTHCYTNIISEKLEDKITKRSEKVSILGELNRLLEEQEENPDIFVDKNDSDSIKKVFINHQLFDEVRDVFDNLKDRHSIKKYNRRNRKCKLLISSPVFDNSITFLEIVKHKWFGTQLTASENRIKRVWEEYKLHNPWLSEDIETTLELSPFDSHLSLFYYISSSPNRTRRIMLNCPPIRAKKFLSQLLLVAKRCLGTNLELSSSESLSRYVPIARNMTSLYLATCFPDSRARDETFAYYTEQLNISRHDLRNTDRMHYKDVELLHLLAYKKDLITTKELLDYYFAKGNGMIVTYIKEQEKRQGKYVGYGIISLRTYDLRLKLKVVDKEVMQIITNNVDLLVKYSSLFNEKIKILQLEFNASCRTRAYVSGHVMENVPGTEVIEDPLLEDTIYDYEVINIEPDLMAINTYQLVRGKNILLSSLKTHDMCIASFESSRIENHWIKAWCEMLSLNSNDAIRLLGHAVDNDNWEDKFLVRTFKKRYEFRFSQTDYLPEFVQNSAKLTVNIDEIIQNAIENAADFSFLEEIDAEDDEDLDNFETLPIDLFSVCHTFDTSITDFHKESFMSVHPLWDKLIQTINHYEVKSKATYDERIEVVQKAIYGRSYKKNLERSGTSWRL